MQQPLTLNSVRHRDCIERIDDCNMHDGYKGGWVVDYDVQFLMRRMLGCGKSLGTEYED